MLNSKFVSSQLIVVAVAVGDVSLCRLLQSKQNANPQLSVFVNSPFFFLRAITLSLTDFMLLM